MNKQICVKVLRLSLLLAMAIWGVGQAGAQGKANAHKAAGRQATITDAAGRVHKRPLPIRETDAQRKAVAARYKALQAKAAAQKLKSEVKK